MLGQLHDPDLHLLRLFVTVVEAGGFSAAQGVLGLSQPSISQQMARLETRLGYRLCSRGKRGFALTDGGLAQAQHPLRGAEATGLDYSDEQPQQVQVGVVYLSEHYIAPDECQLCKLVIPAM